METIPDGGITMNYRPILLIVILITVIGSVSAGQLTDDWLNTGATAANAKNVTLTGWNAGENMTVWAEFGLVSGPTYYPWKSENVTTGGNFSVYIQGLPLMAGQTYYYRWTNYSYSSTLERSFTMGAVGYVQAPEFAKAYNTIRARGLNLTNLPFAATSPYTDLMGNQMVWGFIFGLIFLGFWIMTEDVTIPVILGLITSGSILYGGSLSLGIPPEFVNIAQSLLIISVIGLIYTLIRKR